MGLLKTNIKSALNRSNCVLVKVEIQNLTELNDGRVSAAYVFKLVGAYKTPKEKKEP